jgi:hypothetical protein
MRLAKLRGGTHPTRADYKKNLRQNEIAQSQRLFEGGALLFNGAFRAIELADHARNCRACALLAHRKMAGEEPTLQRRLSRAPLATGSAVPARFEIRGGGFCRRHMRCNSRIQA